MDKYFVVKVPDATSTFPPNTVVSNGQVIMPTTNLARIGKAIRLTSEEHFIGASWIVTHTNFLTTEESETIAYIFANVLARAKQANPKKYKSK